MPRTSRLFTTIALLSLTGAALLLGGRWSLASPLPPVAHPPVRPPVLPGPEPRIQPRLDVAFVVDTTGSMADEIAVVKHKISDMAQALLGGQPRPDVRFALVCFRDRGDTYVTQTFPFTRDIASLHATIATVEADGGGDTPESVNEALHVALDTLDWSTDARVSRQIFLIGDAAPHRDYAQDYDYRVLATQAAKRRIAVDSISCSGMDAAGVDVWRHLAKTTNGRFEYLTYARDVRQADGSVKTYLEAGGDTYAPADEVTESEWRDAGAAGLLRDDKAEPVAPASVRGTPVGEKRNNLDAVMLQRLKERAVAEQGVTYEAD